MDGDISRCVDRAVKVANPAQGQIWDRGLISFVRTSNSRRSLYGDYRYLSDYRETAGRILGYRYKRQGFALQYITAEQTWRVIKEGTIPTALWKAEPAVMKHYLSIWPMSASFHNEGLDIRTPLEVLQ